MKPFLKWAGGKTQLLPVILENLPKDINEATTYVEPFVGAGAVFIHFLENDFFDRYVINDINGRLINLYKVIRDDIDLLINALTEIRDRYISLSVETDERKEMYYEIRDRFNSNDIGRIELAAYFVFLNKTCFNGLYRENSKGAFNVPIGSYEKNPDMFDENILRELSIKLNKKNRYGENKVIILNESYLELEGYIDRDTFVYFDPPYRPITKGGFNAYDKSGFNDDSQKELALFFRKMDRKGARVMLSNSDPKNLDFDDEFFDVLYQEFVIQRVNVSRAINSNGKGRGAITEILVYNGIMEENSIKGVEVMNYLSLPEEQKVDEFTKSLVETNRAFNFYVDWSKPEAIKKKYNIEFNMLNALIETEQYDEDFKRILKKMPTVINLFPILFCLAKSEIEELKKKNKTFKVLNTSDFDDSQSKIDDALLEYRFNIDEDEELTEEQINQYLEFTNKIGLKYLFENILEKHVIDYVSGCEVGIDTNARKNRGGMAFELALDPVIKELAEVNGVTVLVQKQFKVLRDYGFEISEDIENRKADFILIKENKIMNIEVNFFNGSGSKPEEIIDSYINRQQDLSDNDIEFMLITDGVKCWGNNQKSQLKKGFRHLKYLCNYKMASNGYLKEVINKEF